MSYLIGVEVSRGTYATGLTPASNNSWRVLVYGGNMQGEVYIYEVSNIIEAITQTDEVDKLQQA